MEVSSIVKDTLCRLNPEAVLFTDMDDALCGTLYICRDGHMRHVAVYMYEKLVDIVIENSSTPDDVDGIQSRIDAEEYVDFNMCGPWVGYDSPIVISQSLMAYPDLNCTDFELKETV